MTRNEVIMALEICTEPYRKCDGCPLLWEDWCRSVLNEEALALLKSEPRKVDCNAANRDAGGCLGYCYSDNDDEPIDVCKRCEQYTGNAEEADHDEG